METLSLEQAKELLKSFERPVNGNIILIGNVAPEIRPSGVLISPDDVKNMQKELNNQGLLVVFSPYKEKGEKESHYVYEGERVLLDTQHNPTLTKIVKSKEYIHPNITPDTISADVANSHRYYKKYVAIVIHSTAVCCTLNTNL